MCKSDGHIDSYDNFVKKCHGLFSFTLILISYEFKKPLSFIGIKKIPKISRLEHLTEYVYKFSVFILETLCIL